MILDDSLIYIINLPEDVSRRKRMEDEMSRVGLKNVQYISANKPYDGYKASNYQYAGELGVVCSQLKALMDARRNAIYTPYVMILEDDVHFLDADFKRVFNRIYMDFEEKLSENNEHWDMLYIGGRPKSKIEPYTKHIARVGDYTMAMAYILKVSLIHDFIQFCFDRMGAPFPHACYDNMLNDFSKTIETFTFSPSLCIQVPGHSTIRNEYRDYTERMEHDWKVNT